MSPAARFRKTSLALASLLFISIFLTSLASSPQPASAQVVYENIIHGKSTAYNIDQAGDKPWRQYSPGDLPSIMTAKRIGSGAVVAAGTVATCRNTRWNNTNNSRRYLDTLLDKAFQWMKPGAKNVLWYEGYSVYNDTTQCSQLVAALGAKGYLSLIHI